MRIKSVAHGDGLPASRVARDGAGGSLSIITFDDGQTATVETTVTTQGTVWVRAVREDGSIETFTIELRRRIHDATIGS